MVADVRTDAYIGLGSNLGDRLAWLEAGTAAIAGLPATTLVARSSVYESPPLQADGDDYLNAVVQVRTAMTATELLHALQAVEARHGRVRSHRNAPRTLDLDLLLWGDLEMRTPELTLPHPRLAERAFVLVPLAEIAPDLELPGQDRLAARLAAVRGQALARLPR